MSDGWVRLMRQLGETLAAEETTSPSTSKEERLA